MRAGMLELRRFTPTRVGNTSTCGRRGCDRLRFTPTCVGNTYGFDDNIEWRHGSPPRVWGIPLHRQVHGCVRFTPTCVGNTWPPLESTRFARFTPTCVGNTPRILIAIYAMRFTPTCVGNTYSSPTIESSSGSPPRVWGIRWLGCKHRDAVRFTPTCVGNTVCQAMRVRSTVHPHVCGEYGSGIKLSQQ